VEHILAVVVVVVVEVLQYFLLLHLQVEVEEVTPVLQENLEDLVEVVVTTLQAEVETLLLFLHLKEVMAVHQVEQDHLMVRLEVVAIQELEETVVVLLEETVVLVQHLLLQEVQ
jgi:hypothetical protein